jgi:NAD-reducing hydrogenase small subunit
MSLLDIDLALLDVAQHIELDRSPLTDIKRCGPCDIGLIEGGVCNAENVHVLREFRKSCRLLIAVGACAITGGVPALRNHLDLWDCFQEVYRYEPGTVGGTIPNDPELPLPFDQVRPIYEVVRVDGYLPGCPPPAEAFAQLFADVRAGRPLSLAPALIRYD